MEISQFSSFLDNFKAHDPYGSHIKNYLHDKLHDEDGIQIKALFDYGLLGLKTIFYYQFNECFTIDLKH